jgi:recombination associated protein RdgC
MWFKNLSLYRLPDDVELDLNALEPALAGQVLKPCGPLEQRSQGFVSPYPPGHENLQHIGSNAALIELGTQERVLPSAVVRQALRERIDAYRSKMNRTPGKRVREQLKDEVLHELLPRAFVKPGRCGAYIDLTAKLLVVDSGSDKPGEALVGKLREALGSFAAEPVATEESVGGVLTNWLLENKGAGGFELGDEVELKDPLDTRAVIKVRKHDLALEEVREHARQGKRVSQLALVFDHRIGFTLDENFKLRKLKFLDLVQEELGDISGDDAIAEIDARFTLMTLELRRMFEALHGIFKLI